MDTIDDVAGLVSIGQLAKAAGVSSRTIRYYEELGILPEPRRTSGGTRKYPREYCGYIETALALKDLGFRLEEVKPLARLALGRTIAPGAAGQGRPAGGGPDPGAGPAGGGVAQAPRVRGSAGRDGQPRPARPADGISGLAGLMLVTSGRPGSPRPGTAPRASEAGMTSGIILLVLIAALVAFVLTRMRRRMGMGNATGRTWIIIMAVVILVVLGLWAYQTQGG